MTVPDPAPLSFPELTPRIYDFTSGPDLDIVSVAAELPPATLIEDVVRDGRYTQEDADLTGLTAVTIAEEPTTLFDLTSAAALTAIKRAAVPAADIGTVLFISHFPYSRPPIFNISAAVAEVVGAPSPFVAEMAGGCTAGLDALQLAAQRLLLCGDRAALIVGGDLWRMPHIDRFNTERGFVFADGAAAVVLGRDRGYARLICAATVSDPSLSQLHAHVPSDRTPIDVIARARAFLGSRMAAAEAVARLHAGMAGAVDAALAQAGIGVEDLAYILVPAVGKPFLHRNYLEPLGVPVSRTTWDHSAVTGHTGGVDVLSALAYLVDRDRCGSGDYVLLLADGAGFQWNATVIQVR
jgi:3-oxoacyl-[acyl-carrier-protein] synthase III